MAGCEAFNYKVSLTVVQKGFEKSLSDGVRAIGQEGRNAVSRIQEILAPKTVEFIQIYERRGKRLHWEGDKHPVEYHLRCYTVWLTGQEASRGLVLQSKLDRQVWSQVEKQALQLDNGMAVQWLAFRGIDPEQGIALQQIENNNGVLRQTSRLLPFEKLEKIEEFLGLIGEERENISVGVDSESGLSELAGWVVIGETIDFHQDLPGLIEQVSQPLVLPDALSAMTPMVNLDQFRQVPEVIPITAMPEIRSDEPAAVAVSAVVEMPAPVFVANETDSGSEAEVTTTTVFETPIIKPIPHKTESVQEFKVPLPVFTASSFWFEVAAVAAASNIVESSIPLFVANEITSGLDLEAPLRLDLEGISKVKVETQTVDLEETKIATVIVFEAPIIEPTVISLEPEEKFKPLATTKQRLNVTVVEDRCCFAETALIPHIPFRNGMPTRLDLEGQAVEPTVRKTTGTLPESSPGNPSIKIEEVVIYQVPQIQSKTEIPIYRHHWQAAAIKDIPEWVWQGTAAIPDEIIDWSWFLVTMFYALLNTKVLLNGKIS